MKQFIKLYTNNTEIRININHIISYSGNNNGSKVLIAGIAEILDVNESPELIDQLIEQTQ